MLFGERSFADVIKLSVLRGRPWIIWMDPKCNHVHAYEPYRGEGKVKTEAEMGVVWPQAKEAKEAKELLEPPKDGRRNRSLLEFLEGIWPCRHHLRMLYNFFGFVSLFAK